MEKNKSGMKFVRIRGRIVPIKSKSKKLKTAGYGETVNANVKAINRSFKNKKAEKLRKTQLGFAGAGLAGLFISPQITKGLVKSFLSSGHAARKSGNDILKQMGKGAPNKGTIAKIVPRSQKMKFLGQFAKNRASKYGIALSVGTSLAAIPLLIGSRIAGSKRNSIIRKDRDSALKKKGKKANFWAR